MKKIMILGGGKNQLPLLKAAKEEGYITILCDYNQDPPGLAYSDHFYQISANDRQAVYEVAVKERVDGIVANTEALMETLAWLTETLKLTGNQEKAVSILGSKHKFRQLQYSIGAYAPQSVESDTIDDLYIALETFSFPIIIKPSQSSGSRGTTIINSADQKQELEKAFQQCCEFSRNGRAVAEEYIDMATMDEVEAEIFVHQGKILWDGLLLTLRNAGSPLIPTTDIYPLPYSQDKIARIKSTLEKTIQAAGITHGEYNAELYFTPEDKVFVMEINARQGGDNIPSYVHSSCGVDLHRLLVTTSVGDNDYWEELKSFQREIRYITHHPLYPNKTGTFRGVYLDEQIRPYLIKTELNVQDGHIVHSAEDATGSIGYVDFMFPDNQTQLQFSMEITDFVKILAEDIP